METIDLGIKFVKGWEPTPVPDPGTDVTGGLAQTGDFNIALIVGLVLFACAVVGFCAYALIKNKQLVSGAHEAKGASAFLNFSNFSLQAKIISAILAIVAVICIACGCFSMNAHAAEGSITVTPNTISAVVSEEGQITSWDPANVTLTNTSTTDKFDIKSCKVALTNEAKNVDALKAATIKITGFNGKVVFEGQASETEKSCTGLSLDKSGSTNLAFEIAGTFDISQLESLFDKQLFKISLNAKESFPEHANLYEYTLSELQQVSAYLAENYTEESTDPVCVKFRAFRDGGLTDDGSDNGVAMNDTLKNHWAIDKEGRLLKESGFVNDTTTIQARIIGIREDKDADGKDIGLTFMTTHALASTSMYQDTGLDFDIVATYGWAGPNKGGECTLQSFLNSGTATLFPSDLSSSVKAAKKGYHYSNDAAETPNYSLVANKFWAPSMKELYGDCSGDYAGYWPNEHEGYQYKSFLKKVISQISYGPFKDIDKLQDGTGTRAGFVWSRSLSEGGAFIACGVDGNGGGGPGSGISVDGEGGVVACFCI